MDALKDWRTTVPGIVIILVVIVASLAMFKGFCSFDRFWEVVLYIFALLGVASGTKLITMDSREENK